MNAKKAYEQIEKSAKATLTIEKLFNLSDLALTFFLIYKIWWDFELGFFGIIPFALSILFGHSIILKPIFTSLYDEQKKKAAKSAMKLVTLYVISAELFSKLIQNRVDLWPQILKDIPIEK